MRCPNYHVIRLFAFTTIIGNKTIVISRFRPSWNFIDPVVIKSDSITRLNEDDLSCYHGVFEPIR